MTEPLPLDLLLVEDNPHDADLTLRALRRHDLGHRIFVLEDGAEALDFIFCRGGYERCSMDRQAMVILLDIKLLKVDGLEILRGMKSDERTRSIPVVMLTSSREEPDLRRAYSLGANGYVVKPVEFAAFRRPCEAWGNIG